MRNDSPDINTSYRVEVVRKAIHFSSISIPIFYFFTPRNVALTIFIPLTAGFLFIDIARHYYQPVKEWFNTVFGRLLRSRESDREKKRLNGATYVLISGTLCILIFPKIIAVTSFIILIISDMTSALIGRRFGRRKFLGKSLEGSAAFFVSAIIIIALTPKIQYISAEYIVGSVAATIGTIVEALPWDIDDNLSIPLAVGLTLWAGYTLFLPTLDIYKFG